MQQTGLQFLHTHSSLSVPNASNSRQGVLPIIVCLQDATAYKVISNVKALIASPYAVCQHTTRTPVYPEAQCVSDLAY